MWEGMDLYREKTLKAVIFAPVPLHQQLSFKHSNIYNRTFCDNGNILYVTAQYGNH